MVTWRKLSSECLHLAIEVGMPDEKQQVKWKHKCTFHRKHQFRLASNLHIWYQKDPCISVYSYHNSRQCVKSLPLYFPYPRVSVMARSNECLYFLKSKEISLFFFHSKPCASHAVADNRVRLMQSHSKCFSSQRSETSSRESWALHNRATCSSLP